MEEEEQKEEVDKDKEEERERTWVQSSQELFLGLRRMEVSRA